MAIIRSPRLRATPMTFTGAQLTDYNDVLRC
jgi:hypothetical protein